MNMIVAAFDFDGTLTKRDSLLFLLIKRFGYKEVAFQFFLLAPYFLGFLIGLISRQKMKEKILEAFFDHQSIEELKKLGKEFADQSLDQILNPKMIETLKWHQQQGHFCVLISASLDIYLYPWAERYKIKEVLCSRLEISQDRKFTGRLLGNNCRGPEKVRRLIESVGPRNSFYLYAYGDSRGDLELLETADIAHWV